MRFIRRASLISIFLLFLTLFLAGQNRTWSFTYHDDGDADTITTDGTPATRSYDGDLVTGDTDGLSCSWDENGQLTERDSLAFTWNWAGRLQSAYLDPNNHIALKYDLEGNRIAKSSTQAGQTTTRHYILDLAADLPTVLLEVDPSTGTVIKAYIHAQGQVLAQHAGPQTAANRHFYLHDRLGSARLVIATNAAVDNTYTYGPFGERLAETTETLANPFGFTGQWYDGETTQAYHRARLYDPVLQRFTARDPYPGDLEEPLTLHAYLYCLNDPANLTDPSGEFGFANVMTGMSYGMKLYGAYNTGNRILGYAQDLAAGVALQSVLMNVAIDSAMDYAGGKIFGLALKGAGAVAGKVIKAGGKFIERNHVIPLFLGGAKDGMRNGLSRNLHRGKGPNSWHNILRKKLTQAFGSETPKGLKTEGWDELLRDPVKRMKAAQCLVDAAGEFDEIHGGDIMSTAVVTELAAQWY